MIIVRCQFARPRSRSLRRRGRAHAIALCCLALCGRPAAADTGIRALDEPAIQAKTPDKVFLDAIARAGNRLVAGGEHGVIITSDDNGLSWTQAAVPVNVEITAIAFASPTQGWAVGHYGVILHTRDAGATWQVQLNGLQANQLTLAAAQAAVAAGDPSPGTPLAMLRASHFISGGADKPFLCIWAQSPRDAIMFGAYRLAMKTTDGGAHWTDWSLHVGDPYSHHLYDMAAVNGALYMAAETGLVFRSTDGGQSFTELAPPGNATLFGVIGTGDHGVLVFGVAGEAFLGQSGGGAILNQSGGAALLNQTGGAALSNQSGGAALSNQTGGAAVVNQAGGESWQPIAFGTSDNLIAATQLRDGRIVVANESGTLYQSNDFGRRFTPLKLTIPMAIFALAQAQDGSLILAGNDGVKRIPMQDFKPN